MSDYLKHLPEAMRDVPGGPTASFLSGYLKILEAFLDGRTDAAIPPARLEGLGEYVTRYEEYLDPGLVPADPAPPSSALSSEFLTYLAKWVGLLLDENWDLEKKRRWLERIVPLYRRRGTIAGLAEYLRIFVGDQVRIEEPPGRFILARRESSILAKNTFVGSPAYFFRIFINYAFGTDPFDIAVWRNLIRGTQVIVDLERPAHTYYLLDARTRGMILGRAVGTTKQGRSTLAKDTLLWSKSQPI